MSRSLGNIIWGGLIGSLFTVSVIAFLSPVPWTGIVFLLLGLILLPVAIMRSKLPSRVTHVLSSLIWIGLLATAIGGVMFASDGDPAVMVICLIPVAVIFILTLIVRSSRSVRRRRAMVVIAYLEQAIRANLPLPRMLAAAEASESGAIAARLFSLRRLLETGSSISDALDRSLRELPARSMGLIAAAERIGQLPKTLDRLIREDRVREARDPVESAYITIYPVVMSTTVFIIVSMILVFVMPKFEQIFKDFRIDLPWMTQLMLVTARSFGIYLGPVLLLGMLAFIISAMRDRYWPAREWSLNLLGRFFRNRDMADACGVVADGLRAGLPLDAAVRSAADLPVNSSLRWKLYRWGRGIEQGLTSVDSARRAGMPKLLVGLTATADIPNADEVYRFLARYYASRFSRLAELARGALVPVMVFFFAIIVGAVALALFLPIVQLIDGVPPHMFSL